MKRYKIIVDGKTIYKDVNPDNEQKFFEKYGKYDPVLIPKYLEEVSKQKDPSEVSQPQINQKEKTEPGLEFYLNKIKESENKIAENKYEERLKSINDQLKSLDQKSETEKYNRLVNNYNSILKDYEKEYSIYTANAKKYNDIYLKENPRISNNPIGYSLVDSRFQNIELGDELPKLDDYDMTVNEIGRMAKRAEEKRLNFISSTPDQILTYKTAKEWFDLNINYSDDVRKKVIEDGTHGYNPKTQELFELTEAEKNITQATHNDILEIYRKKFENGMLSKEEQAEFLENPELSLPGYKDMSGFEKFILDYNP